MNPARADEAKSSARHVAVVVLGESLAAAAAAGGEVALAQAGDHHAAAPDCDLLRCKPSPTSPSALEVRSVVPSLDLLERSTSSALGSGAGSAMANAILLETSPSASSSFSALSNDARARAKEAREAEAVGVVAPEDDVLGAAESVPPRTCRLLRLVGALLESV